MNRCKLIIPSSGVIDLPDETDIALTYQIADIRQPNKRNADYSKTITVPGTANNNKMFQHIFEIGIDRLFNPNKKAVCILTIDSSSVMKGYMRLRNVKITDNLKEYEIEITGRLADLYLAMGDTKVKDLPWADLDHTLSRANQITSWSTPIGSYYVYPFIDYGYSPNDIDYFVDHFFPALYVKEIWDRIFSYFGYQYSSASGFFTSTYFKSLIVPFNSDKLRLTNAQIEARRFRASRVTTEQTFTMNALGTWGYTDIIFNNDSTAPNQDTGGVYNTATGVWTCGASGYYSVNANLTVARDTSAQHSHNEVFYARIIDITNSIPQVNIYSSTYSIGAPNQQYSLNMCSTTPIFVASGTQVKVQVVHQALETVGMPNLRILIGSNFFTSVDPIIKEGDTVTMANAIDPEMRCSDFVNSIIKMHNLYFEYDKDTANKIHIEPRPDYYNSTIHDWTQKRDLNRELEIIPMGALQARHYLFTYRNDGDYLNDKYQKEIGETYGQRKFTVDNDFLKNTEKEEIIFSPSPLDSTSAMALNVPLVSYDDRYFTRIISVDSAGVVSPKTSNPRILYYGGVKGCKPWTYKSNLSLPSSGVTNYPYAGHLDDPITPTQDLNFGLPRIVYYDPAFNATYTDNNLYNKYWKTEIDEITNYNSSIVTGWFKLSPADVSVIDFRHVYRFDFQNFRLNKIYDYNPLSDGFTKCEFIKIQLGIPFSPNTGMLNGANNSLIGGLPIPAPKKKTVKGNNSTRSNTLVTSNIVLGNNNNVSSSAQKVFVSGDNNSVGSNARNIAIINSSGCIVPGDLGEVVIMNSSGVTVTASNTFVNNNIVQAGSPSGSYTPVLTNATNIAASTAYSTNYLRVGNMVTVSGSVDIDPTAANTQTILKMTPPIASTFAAVGDCCGTAVSVSATPTILPISGIIGTQYDGLVALIFNTGANVASESWYFTYTYRIL